MPTRRKKTRHALKTASRLLGKTRQEIFFATLAALLFALSLATIYVLANFLV
jgi:hypothetical protein